MKAGPTGYLWSNYEWLSRYELIAKFEHKTLKVVDTNMDADNRGDYNIYIELSTVLRTDELKNASLFFSRMSLIFITET